MSANSPQNPSRGCKKSQIGVKIIAIGQAMKTRRISQTSE